MTPTTRLRRVRLLAALAVALLTAATAAVYALAGHQPGNVQSITGCLTAEGKLVKFKLGDTPKGGSCGAQTQVHLSGGDITAVNAGSGLNGGGTNGAVSLAVRQGSGSGLDADELDGRDVTEVTPASGDARTADVPLTGAFQTVLLANITTVGSGSLLASAAVEVTALTENDTAECKLRFDGTIESVAYATTVDSFFFQSLPLVWAQPVGAGTHTVELRCRSIEGALTVTNAGLNVSAHP
jgi:hypothetical protein